MQFEYYNKAKKCSEMHKEWSKVRFRPLGIIFVQLGSAWSLCDERGEKGDDPDIRCRRPSLRSANRVRNYTLRHGWSKLQNIKIILTFHMEPFWNKKFGLPSPYNYPTLCEKSFLFKFLIIQFLLRKRRKRPQ